MRIIYPNEIGGVSIVVPAPNLDITIQELAAQVVPEGVPYEIVEASEIPEDRTFRNSWTFVPSEATPANTGE